MVTSTRCGLVHRLVMLSVPQAEAEASSPLLGQVAVLADRRGVGYRFRRFRLSGELTLVRCLPLLFIQPEEGQHQEQTRRGNNGTAGEEDVEILSSAVHQDSCGK